MVFSRICCERNNFFGNDTSNHYVAKFYLIWVVKAFRDCSLTFFACFLGFSVFTFFFVTPFSFLGPVRHHCSRFVLYWNKIKSAWYLGVISASICRGENVLQNSLNLDYLMPYLNILQDLKYVVLEAFIIEEEWLRNWYNKSE